MNGFRRLLAAAISLGWIWFVVVACNRLDVLPTPVIPSIAIESSTATAVPSPTPSPSFTSSPANTPTTPPSHTSIPPPSPTSFPTSTPTPTPVTFAVIGDYGFAGPVESAVAQLVKSWQVDFMITTGDNNYPIGAAETIDANIGQYYHDFIAPYVGEYGDGAEQNRFFPSLGNHDWYTADAQPYLDYFTLPGNERYYDFIWGPVHFFALNSDFNEPDGIRIQSAQATWLQEGLAASTAPWQLVYFHVPPYSSGYHGSAPVMQWPFAEWGADVVLSGHNHVYERLLVDGIPYFVNGLGGYPSRYALLLSVAGTEVRYNDDYGAMRVTATEERMLFEFIAVDEGLIDTYTIYK